MTMHYRFVTPHRTGKWYPDIRTAQEQAYAIGAGFLDPRSSAFYQYPGTRMETQVLGEIVGAVAA
ncbi:MAG: hypothetical protein IH997_04875 [Proteobacteria bacterium]|nr:hypothetical protein [Pseudomonadota bacterium]